MRPWLALACAVAVAAPPQASLAARSEARPPNARWLVAIDVSELAEGSGVRVRLRTDGPVPEPTLSRLAEPPRLTLELPGLGSALPLAAVELGFGGVQRVRVTEEAERVRVVVETDAAVGARLVLERSGLELLVGDSGEAQKAALEAPAPSEPSPRARAQPPREAVGSGDAPTPPAPRRTPPPPAPDEPTTVYGMELESRSAGERLLVFATRPVAHRLERLDAETLRLRLPHAHLDPTAATRRVPEVGSAVSRVLAFAPADVDPPEVWIELRHAAGATPQVSQKGSILALEFPRAAPELEPGLTLQFEEAEIADVVRAVSRATGEAFVFDGRLVGKITIAVADRVSRDEALEILHAALLMKGFVALPSPGGPRTILPLEALPSGAPWSEAATLRGQAPVATLARLDAADAEEVVSTLRPYLGSAGLALAYRPTNSVILAGIEDHLRRWLALARALDETSLHEIAVRRLRHRSADELAALLTGAGGGTAEGEEPRVVPDARSNALLLSGTGAQLDELRAWIERLDVPAEGRGVVRVLRPAYADPEALAGLLRGLAGGRAQVETQGEEAGAAAAALSGRALGVAVHRSTRSLVVIADAETHSLVADVVAALDRPPPLVAIEALVAELITSEELRLGVDFFVPLSDPKGPTDLVASVLSNPSGGGLLQPGLGQPVDFAARLTREPLMFPVVGPGGQPITVLIPRESVVVTAEGDVAHTRLLARPHLVALSGEEQEVFVGNNVPIPTQQTGETPAVSPLSLRTDIQRQDVGLDLRVRPTVGQAGQVRLVLELDVQEVAPPEAGDVDAVGPTLRQRRLTATTVLRDGEFAVVAMAPEEFSEEVERGWPFLKDLPLLGTFFRFSLDRRLRRQLLVAVQAWIQRDADERIAHWIERRLGFERSLARTGDLRDAPDVAWAVLVTTRPSQQEAQDVARTLEGDGTPPVQVTSWERGGDPRFDVYLTGFRSLAEAGTAANRLLGSGYRPRVVPLPE